jgi:hypothetical protein
MDPIQTTLLYITDDAILAFKKQAEEDFPLYKISLERKMDVLSTLGELKGKVDQLLQKRQGELD